MTVNLAIKTKILIFMLALNFFSCSHKEYPYFDSALNDRNRAPSSVALPANENIQSERLSKVNEQSKIDFLFLKADLLIQEGLHTEAIEQLKEAIEALSDSNTNKDHLTYKLSQVYFKNNQVPEAIVWIEKALLTSPKQRDYNLLAANLYSTNKDYANAESMYKKILSFEKNDLEVQLYLAALYSEQKKYKQSIQKFEELSRHKNYEQRYLVYYYLARTKYEWNSQKYTKEVKADLQKSLKYKPEYLEALQFLGQIIEKTDGKKKVFALYADHQKKFGPMPRLAEVLSQYYLEIGDYDKAYDQLEIVEDAGTENIQVKLKMALILIDKKMYDKALVRLEQLNLLVPESDKVKFYLGSIYQEIKKNDLAISHFLTIPVSSKHYSDAVRNAVFLLKEAKQNDRALTLARKLAKEKSDNVQNHVILAQILEEDQKLNEALNVLNQASLLFPKESQLFYYIGSVYDKKQDKEAMFKNMYKAVELNPQFPLALNYLAYSILETNENFSKAEEYGLRAYSLDKNDPYIADTVGWIYFKKKDYHKAVKYLEQAHEMGPHVSIISEHLGDAYAQLSRYEKANEVYKKALSFETDPERLKQISIKQTSVKVKQNEQVRLPSASAIKKINSLNADVEYKDGSQ